MKAYSTIMYFDTKVQYVEHTSIFQFKFLMKIEKAICNTKHAKIQIQSKAYNSPYNTAK